jgi:hypothetical protein
MNDRQKRESERNIRANDFLQENKADFASNSVAPGKIAELAQRVAKTQTEYQNQIAGDGSVRQDYTEVEDAYQAMRDEMEDVRSFARLMAESEPGIENKFRIPAGNVKLRDLAAARVFADEAAKIEQKFVGLGLDEDFVEQLRGAADTLEEALADAASSTGTRVGATSSLTVEIKATNNIIDFLDPIVRRTYRANPAKLSAWNYASHVERYTPKSKKDKKGEGNS